MAIHKCRKVLISNLSPSAGGRFGRFRGQSAFLLELSSPQIDGVATELEDAARLAGSHAGIDSVEYFLSEVGTVGEGHGSCGIETFPILSYIGGD